MVDQHLEPYDRVSPSLLRGEFAGKSVLITGGGHGIGASVAASFVEGGVAEVILVGRTLAKLEATAKTLDGVKVSVYTADISSDADVKKLFDALPNSPDILINNAGFLATPSLFIEADLKEYWESFTVNVYGTALVTQSYLRHRAAKTADAAPAVVITLNTIGAYSFRIPTLSSYGASKAALARWSELISADIPETTARFISVHPGAVKTDMGFKSGLDGAFPSTNPKLAADFIVWSTSEEAKFLAGRFAWVNWDVEQLVASKDEVIEKDLYRTSLSQ